MIITITTITTTTTTTTIESKLARDLAEKEEANLQLEEHFSSLQEEVEGYNNNNDNNNNNNNINIIIIII